MAKKKSSGEGFDEAGVLADLIDEHQLHDFRAAINSIARPALLLRTKERPEAKIPVGATKIGGSPDLPEAIPWPAYQDGKPLAFLAQIDLGEVTRWGSFIHGLPTNGLLSVFSVWGWIDEDDLDPKVPQEGWQEQTGWTVVLHTAAEKKPTRRNTPDDVISYKGAAVEPVAILSLPNHRVEPPLAALGWSDELLGRFDEMQSEFRSRQMDHWFGHRDAFTSCHQLGGYAVFQQEFPQEVLEMGLAMLLQIGTDENSGMCWGDGGELTFYTGAKELANGRFERVWGTCQGG